MKKILTIAAALFIVAGSASAQGGSFYLGFSGINPFRIYEPMDFDSGLGRTGIVYTKDGDKKTLSFGLAPEFGYFISDRFAVGLGAGFNYFSYKEGDNDSEGTIIWGVNPYARFYPVKIDRFGMYLQLGFNYYSSKREGHDATDRFSVGITPGISYYVSDRVAIHATFGFLGYAHLDKGMDAFGLNLDGNTLFFGLTFGL